ncbi:MAG: hypothetical protein M3R43_06965 [Acidobacteriota bacterium]|nr:hypothetical protein [Acidobacteriota bacterium]
MLSYLQAAILGILQGISELFPISSLGHSIIGLPPDARQIISRVGCGFRPPEAVELPVF